MDGDEDEMLEVQPKKARQHHSSAVVSGGSQGGTGTTWTTLHKDASYLTLNLFSFELHFNCDFLCTMVFHIRALVFSPKCWALFPFLQ